jgi:hypothetical protein
LSKHAKHVPKHRHAPEPSLTAAPRRILRSTVVMSSVAVAATGVVVSGGVLSSPSSLNAAAEDLGANVTAPLSSSQTVDRDPVVSRGSISRASADRRDAADPAKEAALSVDGGPAVTRSVDVADGDPREIAQALMPQFGFGSDQFGCLDSLWTRESNWSVSAHNPSSGAHGIPQALPGSKMASAGPDWVSNPVTQITWGLSYIQDRYGSPCGAWGHSESYGWY